MKIPIKISGKKYKIKAIANLTAGELIDFDKTDKTDLVSYIAWQTGVKLSDAFFAKTDMKIERAVGAIPDVSKIKKPKLPYIDYSKTIQTVGQRHQIESSNIEGYELLVFCLAVSQAQSNNIDDVHKLRDFYLTKPFLEVLPAGFFFYKNLRSGRPSVLNSFNWLLRLMKIRS